MTFGVQALLIINIAAFFIESVFHIPLSHLFALRPDWWTYFGIWELVTYQFLHAGFWHLFLNMLGLYFLGPETERTLGTNRFFTLYFLSGILGGLGWSLLSTSGVCVGASGAIFGVLGAYAALYPNRELYIYGVLPVKAWILVIILGAYEFFNTLEIGSGGHVANSAHLCGGLVGYIYATIIGRTRLLYRIKNRFARKEPEPVSRAEIDRILDKAAQHGIHSLTVSEREVLKRAGKPR